MRKLFSLDVESSSIQSILEGDEVIVDANTMPRGNGKDMGVFVKNGENFISRFTRYGNRIIFIEENGRIQVVKAADVEIIGRVVGGSFEFASSTMEQFTSIGNRSEVVL